MQNISKNKVNIPQHVTRKAVHVWQLPDGTYYRQGNRGSFSTHANPYTRKELTTADITQATQFDRTLEASPYKLPFMEGGKCVKLTVTTIYEVSSYEN